MDACCEQKAVEIETLRGEHRKVLVVVLVINAVLFIVEAAAGLLANSTALLADSLDMLGDSLVYGFSLYVLWRSAEWKAKAAVLKGIVMAAFGFCVLAEAVFSTARIFFGTANSKIAVCNRCVTVITEGIGMNRRDFLTSGLLATGILAVAGLWAHLERL